MTNAVIFAIDSSMKKVLITGFVITVAIVGGIIAKAYIDAPASSAEATKKAAMQKFVPPTKADVLKRVNDERAKVGVAPLVVNENLNTVAQWKAEDMVARNYTDHFLPGTKDVLIPEMTKLTYEQCSYGSENYSWSVGSDRTLDKIMSGWMGSKLHHDAILDPKYTLTGFGIAGTDKLIIVEHFCVAK